FVVCETDLCVINSLYMIVLSCFFFSSRRRHTRSYGDWSSDVCSSDLVRRAVHGEALGLFHRESAQVINAVDVIGVTVREEDAVQREYPGRHELEAQLGWRVDEQPAAARLEQRGGAGALVARVARRTGTAATPYLRHPERG